MIIFCKDFNKWLTYRRGVWYPSIESEGTEIMKDHPSHKAEVVALKRIEGQVRGLQKMIEDKRYCVDILTQIASVMGALLRVQDNILEKHLHMCVTSALKGTSETEKQKKINEMLIMIKKFRRNV